MYACKPLTMLATQRQTALVRARCRATVPRNANASSRKREPHSRPSIHVSAPRAVRCRFKSEQSGKGGAEQEKSALSGDSPVGPTLALLAVSLLWATYGPCLRLLYASPGAPLPACSHIGAVCIWKMPKVHCRGYCKGDRSSLLEQKTIAGHAHSGMCPP